MRWLCWQILAIVVCAVSASLMLAGDGAAQVTAEDDGATRIRMLAYNVEFGKNATAEQIAEALKPLNLDIITFNEVPGGDWTQRVGKVLGMEHHYTGAISSGNHKDKYRSILSRTPLIDPTEYRLQGRGWNPASAVHASTVINGKTLSIYSLHVSGTAHGGDKTAAGTHSQYLADEIVANDKAKYIILAGDFNDRINEPVMNHWKEAAFSIMWDDLNMDVSRESEHYTWNALGKQNAGVIDHIIYRGDGMRATQGGIVKWETPLSDHHPIWAEIVIAEPTAATPLSAEAVAAGMKRPSASE